MDRNNLQAAAKGTEGKNNVCSHHIVAMPYPSTGHINPMMNLCKHLASRIPQILITFVVTEECLASISSVDHPCPDQNIGFETITANTIPLPLKDKETFAGIVMTKMEAPFERILDRLQLPVTAIITDCLLQWAIDTGNRRNIPVAALWTSSATTFSICYHVDLFKEKQFPLHLEEHAEDVIDFIPGISSIRAADVPSFFLGKRYSIDSQYFRLPISRAQYLLCASVYELESQVFDAIKAKINIPVYSVGPLIPYNSNSSTQDPYYMEWLNSHSTSSILYVSMGSFYEVSSAQLDEMVAGVKLSGVKFLWVGRDDTRRLQEDLGDIGLVVPWCDQLRVLSHSSIGGFLTHCGWSSALEGAFAGVPMLTFPIFGDQTTISKQIVEDWKIGRRLNKLVVIKREEIAKIIQTFMDINSTGERKELIKRSRQVKDIIQTAIVKGGSYDTSLDAFIKNITQGQPH